MLHYHVDPGAAAPAYRQLMEQVRYYVASGAVEVGEKLPSIRALARYLGVNPSTVVKAYGELEHLGVIERRQGSGVFVREGGAVPTAEECEAALRGRARALAIEARQMGAADQLVIGLLREELGALGTTGTAGEAGQAKDETTNGDQR